MSGQTKRASASPYFSIVIPAYNEETYIGSCLQAIFSSNYDNARYEVIVVDNGSQDQTYKVAFNSGGASVLQLVNGNVGAVRNYGAAQARGQILVFIDADCLMDNDWLNRAERLIKGLPNCAYGGGVKLPVNATWIEKFWLLEKKGQSSLPKQLIGASTILPKKVFFDLGGFDVSITSGEDTELHNSIVSRNISVIIDHKLDVTHLGNAKTPMQFIKRQIWHSENYMIEVMRSIKDPIFIITLFFLSMFLLAAMQVIIPQNKTNALTTLMVWGLIPALLSTKRMLRAHRIFINPIKLSQIYFLDFLYLSGRSVGIIKGILNLIKKP